MVDSKLVDRAAQLAKTDLLTDMVGEFPELQGIMGQYYAANDGEPAEVAAACMEHYAPRFAGDQLPTTIEFESKGSTVITLLYEDDIIVVDGFAVIVN